MKTWKMDEATRGSQPMRSQQDQEVQWALTGPEVLMVFRAPTRAIGPTDPMGKLKNDGWMHGQGCVVGWMYRQTQGLSVRRGWTAGRPLIEAISKNDKWVHQNQWFISNN